MLSQCRHIQNCWHQVAEFAHGSKGRASLASGLIEAIREKPFNEARNGAIATMTAVMGRMATYSGKKIACEEALKSEVSLEPAT